MIIEGWSFGSNMYYIMGENNPLERDVANMGPVYTLALCLHSQASWKLFKSAGCSLV